MAHLPTEIQSHSFLSQGKTLADGISEQAPPCKIILRRKIKLWVTLQSSFAMVK